MNDSFDLERELSAAQSIASGQAAKEAARVEWALAETCRRVAEAVADANPRSGAGVHVSRAGMALFAGLGSPFTQGMAMGLRGAVRADQLDAIEARLAPSGTEPRQIEVCAFTDPTLHALLAQRGYCPKEWQLVSTRLVAESPPSLAEPEITVRRVQPGEEELYCRVMLAGAIESESVPREAVALILPAVFARGHEPYLAWLGDEAIGGAMLAVADGLAFLSGCAVRAPFRRRGAHDSLIRARVERARELGVSFAVASTMPGTVSCRNMVRHGFAVIYPKIVMVAGDPPGGLSR